MQSLSILLGGLLLVALAQLGVRIILVRLAGVTDSTIDDQIVAHLNLPLSATILSIAAWQSIEVFKLPPPIPYFSRGLLLSAAVLFWTWAANSIITVLLNSLVANRDKLSWVRPRTVPIFRMAGRTTVLAGAGYFFFLCWDLDVTGWLASAGIVGIAVGFAAKDSLATVFAGVTILAYAPYKLGDVLRLENGDRGRVSEISLRTTRIITRDQIEIIVPNTMMANSRLINESGGPGQVIRVATRVGVAYGSDIDQVRQLLLDIAATVEHIVPQPEPMVYFSEFGDSSLMFELRACVSTPAYRDTVIDAMNTRIYNVFNEHNIEIPYPKRDVYLRQPSN